MKRPLFFLFCLTSLIIFLWYPRDYTADPIFPQGGRYDVIAEGEVLTYSRQNDRLSLTLKNVRITFQDQIYSCGKLLVSLSEEDIIPVKAGNILSVTGSLSSIQPARNPGNFDWYSYYLARHISYQIYARETAVIDPRYNFLKEHILKFRTRLLTALDQMDFDHSSTADLLKALLLGDKSSLNEETLAEYEDSGILHILSVSGLHVSLLGAAVLFLSRILCLPSRVRGLISSGLILLYWQLCGSGLSSGRAAIMFICLSIAPLAGRTYDSLSAMSLAGLMFLWDSPLMLFQSGFQLSFGAILGIQLICPAFLPSESTDRSVKKGASKSWKTYPLRLWSSFTFGLGLQLTLLPVTLYHFFRYPLYGIFLNLIVIPLAAPLFILAAIGLLLSLIWLPLGMFLTFPCGLILELYHKLCRIALTLPCAACVLGQPKPARIFLYYSLLLLFCLWKRSTRPSKKISGLLPRLLPVLLTPALILSLLFHPIRKDSLSVTFLDVGQGDCTFLLTPEGTSILIDGGSSDISSIAGNRLIPFLESQGISSLDYVFISHSDDDHINAIMQLIASGYPIDCIILPSLSDPLASENSYQQLISAAAKSQSTVFFFYEGQQWSEGDLTILCLAPTAPESPRTQNYSSLNAASQVLLVEYQGFRLLFTGDCGEEGEDMLVQELASRNLTCQILKAAHHGSAGATSNALLQQLNPQTVIISCGIRNRYGHPHPDMLARAEELGIPCYITASCGAVFLTIQNGQAKLETMLPAGELFYR